jgi:O-antigen ligase
MSIFIAIAVLPVGLAYIYYLSRSVLLGWISLLTVYLYDFSFGADVFTAGGLNLTVVEIVQLCLLFAGIIRTIQRRHERNTSRRIALLYVAIFAFSLVRGSLIHGFAHTARLSSLFVAFLIACLYFLTASYDSESVRKYLRIYLYYGMALTLVAVLAYAGMKIGTVAWAHNDPEIIAEAQGRSLPSGCALTIAFCFFLSLAESRYRNSSVFYKWLPAVFLGMAIFLRHRSVWVVLAAGIASYFFVDRGLFRRLIPIAALAVFFAAAYALIAGIGIQSTAAQISSDSSNEGTLLFRMAMWETLLTESQTVPGVLFGKDLGGGYMQYSVMQHEYIDIPPHNEYLTQFLSVGIAGVVLILAFTIYPLKRFWKLSSTDMEAVEPSASAWVAIIIGIVVYSIPYQPETDAYALLAMANAIVFGLKRGQESPAITAS